MCRDSLFRFFDDATNRIIACVQLIVCGLLVLIAPRLVLRRLKREFEGR